MLKNRHWVIVQLCKNALSVIARRAEVIASLRSQQAAQSQTMRLLRSLSLPRNDKIHRTLNRVKLLRYRTLEEASEYLEMDESELFLKIEKGIIPAERDGSYWVIREGTLYELKQHILLWKSGDWKTFYDKPANFYTSPLEMDSWIVEDMPEPKAVMKEINKDITKKLKLTGAEKLLEVGCGGGLQAILGLKDKVSEYIGCDISYSMIKKAREFLKGTQLIVAEAAALPFETNSFDRILSYSVFGYFPDFTYAKKAVSEFIRVCKPGGIILMADIQSSEENDRKGGNLRYILKRFHLRDFISINGFSIKPFLR